MQIISIFLLTLSAFSRRRYQYSDESYAGNNLLEWQYSDNYNAENNQEYFDSYPRISAYQAAHMPKPAGPPPGKGARPPSHAAGIFVVNSCLISTIRSSRRSCTFPWCPPNDSTINSSTDE